MFGEVLNALAEGFGLPTAEDYIRAEREITFPLSSYPPVRAAQIRCYAYTYVSQRKKAGYVPPSPEELEAKKHTELVEREKAVSRKMMGPNTIYSEISLHDDATRPTKVVQWCLNEFDGKTSAVIIGGVGSGKTYGAIAYISSIGHNAHPQFTTAYKLGELLNRRQYDELAVYQHARFLIIDDLGIQLGGYKAEDFGAWFQDMFAERHMCGLVTIVTSNLSVADLKEAYGERFASRLRESGKIFVTDEGDMRNG